MRGLVRSLKFVVSWKRTYRFLAVASASALFVACSGASEVQVSNVANDVETAPGGEATDGGEASAADEATTEQAEAAAPATSEPTVTASFPEPPDAAPIATCKLEQSPQLRMENGNQRYMSLNGWPLDFRNLIPLNDVEVVVVPVKSPDAIGDSDAIRRTYEQLELTAEYFAEESRGAVELNIGGLTDWVKLPEPLTSYRQPSLAGPNPKFAQAAIDAADAQVNFLGVDIVVFALPTSERLVTEEGQPDWIRTEGFRTEESPGTPLPMSDEGKVPNYLIAGPDYGEMWQDPWTFYAYSIGIMFGMPELTGGDLAVVPGMSGDFDQWALLANSNGLSKAVPAWTRWTMRWLADREVYCLPSDSVTETFGIELVPLYSDLDGFKAVVMPLSDGTAVVLESRRATGNDAELRQWSRYGRSPQGVLAYVTHPDRVTRFAPFTPLLPENRGLVQFNGSAQDALLNEGDSVEFAGLRVTLAESGDSDILLVEPTDGRSGGEEVDGGNGSEVTEVAGDTSDGTDDQSSSSTSDTTSPSTASTTTSVPQEPIELLAAPEESDPSVCRIPQLPSSFGGGEGHTAFPVTFDNLQPDQNVRLLTIPVDWPDYAGDPAALAAENQQVQTFMNYYNVASRGALTFTPTFSDKWYRLPESVSAYPQDQVSFFNPKLAQAGIDAIDPEVDFSQVDMIVFIFPENSPIPAGRPLSPTEHASIQDFNPPQPGDWRYVESDEGAIRNYIGAGLYFDHPKRPEWSYYVHETAHMFAMPDWYLREGNAIFGSTQQIDLEVSIGPLNVWGVMSTQDGPSRTFVAWTRWLLGWLGTSQVDCYDVSQIQEHGAFDTELVALDVYEPGTKAVIVRTGQYSGFLIESRRPVFPDHDLALWGTVGRDPYGLIVYEIDATKGGATGTLRVVPPDGQDVLYLDTNPRSQQWKVDALFNLGGTATVQGIKVELMRTGEDQRDIVRVSPA